MEIITSKSNEKYKYIKSLNEKKFRLKYNEYYLEGIKVLNELLDMYENGAVNDIKFIAYSYDILIKSNGGSELLKRINKIEVYNFEESIFKNIVDTINTQGILVVLKIKQKELSDYIDDSNILIIDRVTDSGNLGTIIRSCDNFNIKNIICLYGTADAYSQKVLRSTMASILRVNIFNLKENEEDNIFKYLKNEKFKIIGTSLSTNTYINNFKFEIKQAYVVGNEASGICDRMLSRCDELIKIPVSNNAESLNVSVATSIILFEQFINIK